MRCSEDVKTVRRTAQEQLKDAATSEKNQAERTSADRTNRTEGSAASEHLRTKRKITDESQIRHPPPTNYSLVDDIIAKSTLPPNVKPVKPPRKPSTRQTHSPAPNLNTVLKGKVQKIVEFNTSLTNERKRRRTIPPANDARWQPSGNSSACTTSTDPTSSGQGGQQTTPERRGKKRAKSSGDIRKQTQTPKRQAKEHVAVTPTLAPHEATPPHVAPSDLIIPVQSTKPSWDQDAEMEDLSESISQSLKQQRPLVDYKGIYLITDTNIFLRHLGLVKKVVHADTGDDQYIVCIPWVVIQELDHIRSSKKPQHKDVSADAYRAILYINRMLEQKNPRLRGQTLAEARGKDAMMPSDGLSNSDDHLLCCCLSLHQQGSRAILVSDDRNLRNKAIINGIEAYEARTFEGDLKDILDKVPLNLRTEYAAEQQEALKDVVLQGAQAVWEKVLQVLQKCLSVVLPMELESALGHDWRQEVAVKPPWTALTALQCALKHWQDCHLLPSSAFSSAIAPEVRALCKLLQGCDQGTTCVPPAKLVKMHELFGHASKVCSHLQLHYCHLAEDVAALKNLKEEWMQCASKESPAAIPMAKPATDVQKGDAPQRGDILDCASAAPAEGLAAIQEPEEGQMCMAVLQDSWSLINDFCGTVSKQFSRCYEYPYQENSCFVSNTATLQTVYRHVYQAREHMQRLLRRKSTALVLDVATLFLEALQELVDLLLRKLGMQRVPFPVTSSQMCQFFMDSKRKEVLDNGYKQIVMFQDTLGYCLLAVTGQDTTRKASTINSPTL